MCVGLVLRSTGSEFYSVGPETAKFCGPNKLSGLEEQQDLHVRPIVDAGSHYRLVKSHQQGMKEQHDIGTCRQVHQQPNVHNRKMTLL